MVEVPVALPNAGTEVLPIAGANAGRHLYENVKLFPLGATMKQPLVPPITDILFRYRNVIQHAAVLTACPNIVTLPCPEIKPAARPPLNP